jgi:transcription initiation factor TFIIF subunit beta
MDIEKPKPPVSVLDFTSESTSNVWLVKIPTYLAEAWTQAERGTELGTVSLIHKEPNSDPVIEMNVSKLPGIKDTIPLDFSCKYSKELSKEIKIFSEDIPGNISLEGLVGIKVDCAAKDSSLLKNAINARAKQTREMEMHDIKVFEEKSIDTYVARTAVIANKLTAKNAKPKKKGEKRERMDQSKLEALIFQAFYKKEYLTLNELDRDLEQPIAYLKEVLANICVYHTSGIHRLHYTIKDEYKSKKPKLDDAT